ncbi:MAG TPA: ATP-grasp domain-containing protein, partial [Dongiaceae bacterium]|nr:ATP-grasp domain-containing protein [Dongiaceae bacterium]
DGILKDLVAPLRPGQTMLVSGPRAVAIAADKRATFKLLRRAGIATPPTRVVPRGAAGPRRLARERLPLVLKPRDGCGAAGVGVVRRPADCAPALRRARAAAGRADVIAQPFIEGIPIGVALVARAGFRGRAAAGGLCVLGVSLQALRGRVFLEYVGGAAPVRGRHARVAERAALCAAAALQRAAGDLRGPVGVDLVLTPRGPVVIEINPRLTTSFIGLRTLARTNPARTLLDGAAGRPIPARAALSGACRFEAGGRVRRLRRASLR